MVCALFVWFFVRLLFLLLGLLGCLIWVWAFSAWFRVLIVVFGVCMCCFVGLVPLVVRLFCCFKLFSFGLKMVLVATVHCLVFVYVWCVFVLSEITRL